MTTSFKRAVEKVTDTLEGISDFSGEVYMTIGPSTANPPLLLFDVTDINTVDDTQKRGDVIQMLTVNIQVWATTVDQALELTDKVHKTLRAADMVHARDNVFTVSEEFMPLDPSAAPGILRVISTYRLYV